MLVDDNMIEIADSKSVVRIRLGINDQDRPYLSFSDADGHERMMLNMDSDGNGSMAFCKGSGQPVLSLGFSYELGAGMQILDPENDIAICVDVTDGVGRVKLRSKGQERFWPDPKE